MDDNPNNMDLFNQFVIEILGNLYEKFPVEQDLHLDEYEDLNSAENSCIFFSTIKFLNREKCISFSKQIYGGFLGVSLTSKSLTLLGTPTSLSKSKTLISQIRESLKTGTTEAYNNIAKEIIKHSVDFAVEKLTKE